MGAGRQVALVLWDGGIGGAEVLSVALANEFTQRGIATTVVFVGQGEGPLARRLERLALPYKVLGLRSGRLLVAHPRQFARVVRAVGADGAVLADAGLMPTILRGGGFEGPLVAVEHGEILNPSQSAVTRFVHTIDRTLGFRGADLVVGVSNYVVDRLSELVPANKLLRIYNGIDLERFRVERRPDEDGALQIGFAGRLIDGKGVDVLLRAVCRARQDADVRLRIAGSGPDRGRLERLVDSEGLGRHVCFTGMIDDLSQFWAGCDVSVSPSTTWIESFSLTTLEAMACGKPVLASASGALPELVEHGRNGLLVEPGDSDALARALLRYAADRPTMAKHAAASRAKAACEFSLATTTEGYLAALQRAGAARSARSPVGLSRR